MSKVFNRIIVTALFIGMMTMSGGAHAQDSVADLLAELSQYKYDDVRIPLREAHLWVTAAMNSDQDSIAVARELATLLVGDSTLDCKLFVCRELARVGGAAEVPALAALLNNADTADMARIALEAIQGPEADAALVAALDTTSGTVRVGVINSLGERGSKDAVTLLRRLAKKGDANEAEAAVAALGKIGTRSAAHALKRAKRGASPQLCEAIENAQRVCAETRRGRD
jgi:hypothetical protein